MTGLVVHTLAVHWDCSVVGRHGHCLLRQPWDSGPNHGPGLGILFFVVCIIIGALASSE
jgi:hypothetical protein